MSIGSGVGESVITSCNLSKLPIKTVGLGNNPFAFGATECDVVDYIPSIYEKGYIQAVIEKCDAYHVDIIIPGSDDEALVLSKNKTKIEKKGYKLIAADYDFIHLTRNKDKMCNFLNQITPICVKNYTKEQIYKEMTAGSLSFPLIAKPRNGSASRGVMILLKEKDLETVPENYIFQELAKPDSKDSNFQEYLSQIDKKINPQLAEISVQIVTDKKGCLIGKMSSYNKLNNGVPIEIIPFENNQVWEKINLLLPKLKEVGLKGPLNIQGRITDKGFKIFEMNPRFTGITGLRALIGFNEVERCIIEWLGIKNNEKQLELSYKKIGVRQTKDKTISIYENLPIKTISEELNNEKLNESEKTVLVTGASGYLGQNLVLKLLEQNYSVFTLARDKKKLQQIFPESKKLALFDTKDYHSGELQLGLVDILIHCAFARPYLSEKEIAESLKFSNFIFQDATKFQIPSVINISSQSVYGKKYRHSKTETTEVAPDSLYALAKYSSELSANNIKQLNESTNVTSLRLTSLSGGQSGLVEVDLITKFVKRVLNNQTLEIYDGSQIIQRMDVRDASQAITELLKVDPDKWESVYNVGVKEAFTVIEIAEKICEIGKSRFNIQGSIRVIPDHIPLCLILDSGKFYQKTKWEPQYRLEDIIESIFNYYLK